MSNVIQLNAKRNIPTQVVINEAIKTIKEDYWVASDYDMFVGYMGQFVDCTEEHLSYDKWCKLVEEFGKVARIK